MVFRQSGQLVKEGHRFQPTDVPGLKVWISPRREQRVSSIGGFTNWAVRAPNDFGCVGVGGGAASITIDDVFAGRGTMNLTAQREITANAYSAASGSHYFASVLQPTTTGETLQYVMDSDTGTDRLIFAHLTDSSGQVGWYDGSWHSVGSASTSAQVLEWVLGPPGDSGNGYVYRNGTLVGSAGYTARAVGTSVAFLDHNDNNTTGSDYRGYVGDMLWYAGQVSDRDRARLRRYLARKHSILDVV